jgi:uncharacterized lipoprotein YmbA
MHSFFQPLPNASRLVRALVAASLLTLVFAGCVRLLEPRPSNINYYLLDGTVGADTASVDTSGLTVGLRRPQLASYLDATRIVTRHSQNSIRFSDFHRWGEDLDRALNRVVALNLERQPGIQSVETVPWPSGFRSDYVVQLRVLRFEGVGPEPPGPDADDDEPLPEGHSQMAVRWTILGPDGETPKHRGLTRHREEDWPVTDYADLAAKLDTSLTVLSDDIGTRLRALDRP